MASTFILPRMQLFDADGDPIVNGLVYFYRAGTTLAATVYANTTLVTPLSNPVAADAGGFLPAIYCPPGQYKIEIRDEDGAVLYVQDQWEVPVGSGSGPLSISNGGTGSPTAVGALTNLGAASQVSVSALAVDLATVSAIIDGSIVDPPGDRLGNLAGLDTITRTRLGTGFGTQILQVVQLDITAYSSTSTAIPYDDTIPTETEGAGIGSQAITPKEATSFILVEWCVYMGASGSATGAVTLFEAAAGAAAIAASGEYIINDSVSAIVGRYVYSNTTITAKTFSLNAGVGAGTAYVNGSAGARKYGGRLMSFLRLTEYKVY